METKPTNLKDALGVKKAPLHLVPTGPLYEVGLAMLEGGRKYGAHNYRAVGTRASVYYDAALRHINQWWEGEDVDPESGIHHLMKAAACLFVQRDSQIMGNDIDDRPIKYPYGLPLNKLNKQAADMVEKYVKCAKPFLALDFSKRVPAGTLMQYCDCGSVHPVEDNEPEVVGEFAIRHGYDSGWHISTDCNNYLWKDLKLHKSSTGYIKFINEHNRKPEYGEAPGYYKSKTEARETIKAYKNKPVFEVCCHDVYWREDIAWYVIDTKSGKFLHKDLQLRGGTHYLKNNCDLLAEAPGYYPTKEIAEAYVKAYEEKNRVAR